MMKISEIPKIKIRVTYVTKNGEKMKLPTGENNSLTLDEISKRTKAPEGSNRYSLYLKHTNICVVDVDDGSEPSWCKGLPRTKTKKGFHYYVNIPDVPEFSNELEVFKDFKGDLLVNKRNVWEKFKEYEKIKDIVIPVRKYEDIKPYLNEDKMNMKNYTFESDDEDEDDKPRRDVKKKDKKKKNNKKMGVVDRNVSYNRLKRCINAIDEEHADSYDTWINIIMAIYNVSYYNDYEEKGMKLIHYFSEQSDKYDEQETNTKIKSFEYKKDGHYMGTIMHYIENDDSKDYYMTRYETYVDMKELFEKDKVKIMRPASICDIKDGCYNYKLDSFNFVYGNVMYYDPALCKKNNASKGICKFIKRWLDDQDIYTFRCLDFYPNDDKCPDEVYNMFDYFKSEIEPDNYDDNVNLEFIFDHIKLLVNNDEKGFKYVLTWLAQLIQQPDVMEGVALIFKSEQGAGKNIFFDWFGRYVAGHKYYFSTSDPKMLFDRFAIGLKNKLLINYDETSGKDTFSNSDRLKFLITQPQITYEQKGFTPIEINNYARWIFTSNNNTPLKIEVSDRRFVAFECSSKYVKNGSNDDECTTYFDNLYTNLKDVNVAHAFYNYLMNYDISAINLRTDRVITEYYDDLKSINVPLEARFLEELLYKNKGDAIVKFKATSLYKQFGEYLDSSNVRNKPTLNQFSRNIKSYNGITRHRTTKGQTYNINFSDVKKYMIHKQYIKEEVIENEYSVSDDDSDPYEDPDDEIPLMRPPVVI